MGETRDTGAFQAQPGGRPWYNRSLSGSFSAVDKRGDYDIPPLRFMQRNSMNQQERQTYILWRNPTSFLAAGLIF